MGLKDKLGLVISAVVGSGIGIGIAAYADRAAEAAYRVRPALHDVGLWDAILSNHGEDWIMHNNPEICYPAYIVLGILVSMGAYAMFRSR